MQENKSTKHKYFIHGKPDQGKNYGGDESHKCVYSNIKFYNESAHAFRHTAQEIEACYLQMNYNMSLKYMN